MRQIINQNLRPLHHPYFNEYRHLQRLCVQILRYEEIKYGHNEDEIYGVLFDGAWLWEEYLNTILRDCGYMHPQNKMSKGRITLFTDGSGYRYPDFYKEGIVPFQNAPEDGKSQPKTLNGYGGSMNIYGITVDTPANSFKDYCVKMHQYERKFVGLLPQQF